MSQTHPPSEELFAYRDGELDPERRSLIEAHILSCTRCSAAIEDLSDAEGALRAQTPEPDAAYYERMTDSVLRKVGGAPAAAERPAERAPAPAPRPADPAVPRVRSGRRRNFEDEPRGRAPGLPWPAIISTVSAAAAVVVVVVLLFQRQDAWRHAPAPGVLGGSEAGAPPASDSKLDVAPPAEEEGQPGDADAPAATGPADDAPSTADRLDERAPLVADGAKEKDRSPASTLETARDERISGVAQKGEIRTESAEEALPDVAARRQELGKASIANVPQAAVTKDAGSGRIGPTYAEIVARYGLPDLYDPARVRSQALLGAEADLRTLYQTGGAAGDSARARLYLAEAARLRAGDDLDAETYDTIVHHYQRALRLSKDAETARMIRRRLEDFVSRSAPTR